MDDPRQPSLNTYELECWLVCSLEQLVSWAHRIHDALAAAGAFLARNWTSHPMAVVDGLGDEFLESVRDGNQVEVREDGTVVVRG